MIERPLFDIFFKSNYDTFEVLHSLKLIFGVEDKFIFT